MLRMVGLHHHGRTNDPVWKNLRPQPFLLLPRLHQLWPLLQLKLHQHLHRRLHRPRWLMLRRKVVVMQVWKANLRGLILRQSLLQLTGGNMPDWQEEWNGLTQFNFQTWQSCGLAQERTGCMFVKSSFTTSVFCHAQTHYSHMWFSVCVCMCLFWFPWKQHDRTSKNCSVSLFPTKRTWTKSRWPLKYQGSSRVRLNTHASCWLSGRCARRDSVRILIFEFIQPVSYLMDFAFHHPKWKHENSETGFVFPD